MSTVSSDLSHETILSWLGEYVKARWENEHLPTSGARGAHALAKQFGKIDYASFGAARFKDFLLPGDGKYFRLMIVGSRDEIYPVGVNATHVSPSAASVGHIQRLRPDVWAAFTGAGTGTYHFDRSNQTFQLGAPSDPERHIGVTPVTEEAHQQWFIDFVNENDPPNAGRAREFVRTPNWAWRAQGPDSFLMPSLRSAWRRTRVRKVHSYAESWCNEHGIKLELSAPPLPRPGTDRHLGQQMRREDREASLRNAVLSAIQRMSTEELLRLPIPYGYFLRPTDNY